MEVKTMTEREMTEKAIGVCKRNKKLFEDLDISDFARAYESAKKKLYAIKLREDYGIPKIIDSMVVSAEPDVYVRIDDGMYIASMGKQYSRPISWSADGRQPKGEVMLEICFPTGPYILGNDYPKELFAEMWKELKTYDFEYVDDVNHCLYFPLDKAAPIANAYRDILSKYRKRYRDEVNIRRAAKLRLELEKLEKEQGGK